MITERRFRLPLTFLPNDEFIAPVGVVDPLQRGCSKIKCNTDVRGKRIGLVVTGMTTAPIPRIVKSTLIGWPLDAVFTRQQLIDQLGPTYRVLPKRCLLAYAAEVVEALESINRYDAAAAMRRVMVNPFDLYTLEFGTFRLLPP